VELESGVVGRRIEGSRLRRAGATIVVAMALVSFVLSAAAVWLLVVNPVAVASVIDQGGFALLARDLARLLRDALTVLLKVTSISMPAGETTAFVSESLTHGWGVVDFGRLALTGLGTGLLWRAWPRRAAAPGRNRNAR
jgi:hypothetical protein